METLSGKVTTSRLAHNETSELHFLKYLQLDQEVPGVRSCLSVLDVPIKRHEICKMAKILDERKSVM